MKTIILYGAYDRYNYGDVLMPILFQEYAIGKSKEKFKFLHIALTKADMRQCGGFSTLSISEINNSFNVDYTVVVGGEILGTLYIDVASNTWNYSKKITLFIYKVCRKLFPDMLNRLLSTYYKSGSLFPYMLSDKKYGTTIYNTVGGNFEHLKNGRLQKAKEIVSKSGYFSNRSITDAIIFKKKYGIKCMAYPDSVVVLSKLFPKKRLEKNIRNFCYNFIQSNNRYFIFQSNFKTRPSQYEHIANCIKNICKKNKVKCVLLPIGYAEGHNDVQVLSGLKKYCTDETVMFEKLNIYETAYFISNATAFCGTSLHGSITALSYGVPHCAWMKSSYKPIKFITDWETSNYPFADMGSLVSVVTSLIENEENRAQCLSRSEKLISLAEENFDNIISIINGES